MKITIINQPTNNRGDESAHRSLLRNLNTALPNAKINVLFINELPNTVDQMAVVHPNNTYINIPKGIKGTGRFLPKIFVKYNLLWLVVLFRVYRSYISVLRDADFVICAPGGMCMGGFQNWSHIFNLLLALKYNQNVIYYSRSIGPFPEQNSSNKIFKKRSIEILSRLDFISIRDNRSMKIADQLGISYVKATDTAFLDVPAVTLPDELISGIAGDYIVFVPNSLSWHPAFLNANHKVIDNLYISIAIKLLEQYTNSKIVMLPQLFNNPKNCDEKYFYSLKSKINNDRVIVLPERFGSDIQQKIISQSNMIIGARYHSIVFAINNKISFVALSYEHKIAGLLDILNLSDRCVDISKLGSSDNKDSILETTIKIINTPMEANILDDAKIKANKIAQKCFTEMTDQL